MHYRIRAANRDDIPAIAQVHVVTWRTAYRGIVPAEYLENLSWEARADRYSFHASLGAGRKSRLPLLRRAGR